MARGIPPPSTSRHRPHPSTAHIPPPPTQQSELRNRPYSGRTHQRLAAPKNPPQAALATKLQSDTDHIQKLTGLHETWFDKVTSIKRGWLLVLCGVHRNVRNEKVGRK